MATKPTTDPRPQTQRIHKMLVDTAQQARNDIAEIDEPRARALFETSAEVLTGLAKAYEDYNAASEPVWRR